MFPDYFRDDVFRLETQRLWLRWPTAADAPAIERLAGEADVARHTARIPHPYPPGGGADFVFRARQANLGGDGLTLAIALKQKPAHLIGMIGLEGASETVELGYWLGRPYWGAGLVSEAVEGLLDMVWLATDVGRIEAAAARANPASRRVLEKAGFHARGDAWVEAPARAAPLPAVRFELVRPRARFARRAPESASLPSGCGAM